MLKPSSFHLSWVYQDVAETAVQERAQVESLQPIALELDSGGGADALGELAIGAKRGQVLLGGLHAVAVVIDRGGERVDLPQRPAAMRLNDRPNDEVSELPLVPTDEAPSSTSHGGGGSSGRWRLGHDGRDADEAERDGDRGNDVDASKMQ